MVIRFGVLVSCLLVLPSVSAQDWPQWMGPDRDSQWPGELLSEFPEEGPSVRFRVPVGSGYAGPAVVDSRIYVMDRIEDQGAGIETENNIGQKGAITGNERILCLDANSGKEIWTHSYECSYRIAYPTGPRCTPAIVGPHVYCLGAMGDLKCLETKTGKVVWERSLMKDFQTRPPIWGYASHPLIDGDQLLVPVGGDGSAVVSFNRLTGEENWSSTTVKDIGYAPLVIRAPSEGPRQLIFWHSDGVTSLNPADGSEYWTQKFPDAPSPSVVTIATPVIAGNRLLLSDFYVGALLLEVSDDPPASSIIWKNEGNSKQRKSMMNCMMSTPIVRDGAIYGLAHNGRGQGVIRCVSLEDGTLLWENDLWADGEKPLLFANGFFAENGDRTFIMSDIGDLVIARMNRDGYKELDRTHVLEATSVARGRDVVWSVPAFADGHMIVRNDKEIVSVDLRK